MPEGIGVLGCWLRMIGPKRQHIASGSQTDPERHRRGHGRCIRRGTGRIRAHPISPIIGVQQRSVRACSHTSDSFVIRICSEGPHANQTPQKQTTPAEARVVFSLHAAINGSQNVIDQLLMKPVSEAARSAARSLQVPFKTSLDRLMLTVLMMLSVLAPVRLWML